MFKLTNISDSPLQNLSTVLPDGTIFTMTLYYVPQQLGWFILNLTYNSFLLNGFRITNGPNILRQFKNQIPFGLACFTLGDREPTQQEDFLSQTSLLMVLTADEVEQYEDFLSGN